MELNMMKQKYLSIVIVNFMNYSLTLKCVDSVVNNIGNIDYEIIIIDNCSPNESYEELNNTYKDIDNIKVFKNEKNNGFGFGNNVGVEKSSGKYILFLNPDIVILENAIGNMLKEIEKDNSIGLLSGKLLNSDYSVQQSCRRIIPINQFVACRTPFSKIVPNKYIEKCNNKYLMNDFKHDSIMEVDWVMGACMLIKKELFLQVGGFSKEYFMYFEDVDLCCKVRAQGKKIVYFPEAKMIHLHRQESIKSFNKMSLVHFKSMCKFYYKYYFKKIKILK